MGLHGLTAETSGGSSLPSLCHPGTARELAQTNSEGPPDHVCSAAAAYHSAVVIVNFHGTSVSRTANHTLVGLNQQFVCVGLSSMSLTVLEDEATSLHKRCRIVEVPTVVIVVEVKTATKGAPRHLGYAHVDGRRDGWRRCCRK